MREKLKNRIENLESKRGIFQDKTVIRAWGIGDPSNTKANPVTELGGIILFDISKVCAECKGSLRYEQESGEICCTKCGVVQNYP